MLFLSQPLLPLGQTPHPPCLCPQENQPCLGPMEPPLAVRKLGCLRLGRGWCPGVCNNRSNITVHGFPLFQCSSGRKEKPADPVEWTVMDVVEYFTEAGFPEQATAFQEQVSFQASASFLYPRAVGVCSDPALCVSLSHPGNRWQVSPAHAADRCANRPVHPPWPSPENLRAPHQGAPARPL